MKKELRLGIAVSAVIVTVAGGYYLFRPKREATIPVGQSADASGNKPATVAEGNTGKAADPPQTTARPRPGAGQPQTTANPSSPAAGERTTSRERPNNPNVNRPVRPSSANPPNATPAPVAQATPPTHAPASSEPSGRPAATGNPVVATGQPTNVSTKSEEAAGSLASNVAANPASVPGPSQEPVPSNPGGQVVNPATRTDTAAVGVPASESGAVHRVADASSGAGSVPPGFVSRPDAGVSGSTAAPQSNMPASPRTVPAVSRPENRPIGGTTTATGTHAPAGPMETHRIQPGDTLATLAQSYYGSPKYATFLLESNPELKDPARPAVGTTIRIPPKPEGSPAEASRTVRGTGEPSAADAAGGGRTYRVKPGDSFYSIAKKELGDASRWKELFALNKQAVKGDATNLQIGQIVKLPDK
jgi:nucleoid-associated protein YgaU